VTRGFIGSLGFRWHTFFVSGFDRYARLPRSRASSGGRTRRRIYG